MSKYIKRATAAVERGIAADFGGRRVFCSGAGDEKGDVAVPALIHEDASGNFCREGQGMRIESKVTWKARYSLSSETWAKNVNAAPSEHSVLHIKVDSAEWAVVDYRAFHELVGVTLEPFRTDARSFTLTPYYAGAEEFDKLRKLCLRIGFIFGPYPPKRYDVLILPWPLFRSVVKEVT